ncbi:maltooligosyl trehalose synthase [Devosia sp. YR412]|uniref:malto-oligosyltrehalose synthase n=1 Tax=Devosia sp. YR412 TaxID=1881030 RepID=UPI0008D58C01|nr:malto-oligosyltrehalose synthase [Devosia sp. YR412]SEQ54509.1 maltooligosyl trehalose synthase [Devosia sp. YR412]
MSSTPSFRATYRLQLNRDFTFAHAEALIPYLSDLGISHVYLSPILMARPGSTHGYDTVDHARINPELGNLAAFRSLAARMQAANMGLLVDFVPNHMGVGGAHNGLWLDVLKHGQDSKYAEWFDIDWSRKLLVPFLGKTYAEALAAGDIVLKSDSDGFAIWANDNEKLPLRPEDERTLNDHYGTPEAAIAALTGSALDALIQRQHWRLAHHAVAADEINYRRFFINSDLGGIRIDRPDVFDHAHQLIFQLVEEGLIQGLRIDHVDGLLDPKGYVETLQAKTPRPIYLLIEKILAPHERLRPDWPVDGTTGYEFGAQLTRLLVPATAETALSATYEDFVGPVLAPQDQEYLCKLRVMDNELAAELSALAKHLSAVAWSHGETHDLTENGLRKAIREVIAHLTVYRTYIDDSGATPRDRREIGLALAKARRAKPHFTPALFDFIEELLGGHLGAEYDPRLIRTAIGKFQQYSGPVMAKGLEDTALYRHHRLIALNEVGAHPERFSISVAAFQDANQRRLADSPDAMLTTSTHDTKRGEDLRAIVGAIAEHPAEWDRAVKAWRDMLPAEAIHANDLYLFFQLLLGGWPAFGEPEDFATRIKGAMEKSLREAREHTDWGVNNTGYESRVADFIDAALSNSAFMARFQQDREPFLATGLRKGLVQAALKLTVPGMPDTYRGAEDWEQSFVDPDNRRPVDFVALAQRLANPQGSRDDKLILTQKLLQLRQRFPDLFARGSCQPLDAAPGTIAFQREYGGNALLVVANLAANGPMTLPPNLGDWTDVLADTNGSDALRTLFVGYRQN